MARADGSPSITRALQERHAVDQGAKLTADNFDTWRRAFTGQVAAAWLLSSVFVRTLEDRDLVPQRRLAGPGAEDSQRAFFALCPSLSERDYLLSVFRELEHLPAAQELFDAQHNPVWLLGPSAELCQELLAFFRAPQAAAPAFRFGGQDTRFLGDLYQDLSENVRKRYALLQPPHFVEAFILDQTLDRAIERFISYPGCESEEDGERVYGWAGWDHLQRAQALAALYNARREEGWAAEDKKERLLPMLAGLLELMPWLLQWHNEPSEELGGARPGEQFGLFLEAQCTELGFTHEQLRAWRPAEKRQAKKKAARKTQ